MGKFAFRDNRNVLNSMLSKPDGLLAVVDEQSRAPDASDGSILSISFQLSDERIYKFIQFV